MFKRKPLKLISLLLLMSVTTLVFSQENNFKPGWYAGLNAGASLSSSLVKSRIEGSNAYIEPPWLDLINHSNNNFQTVNSNDFTGGVVGGYNWTMNKSLVGLELDFNSLSINNKNSIHTVFPDNSIVSISNTVSTNWLATIRPRIGFTFNNLLVYVTTGLAIAQLSRQAIYSDLNPPPGYPSAYMNKSATATKIGWTAGAGAEWLLTKRWSLKAEYLFITLPNFMNSGEITIEDPLYQNILVLNTQLQLNMIRAGINYHF